MAQDPSSETKQSSQQPPAPEVLQPQAQKAADTSSSATGEAGEAKPRLRPRHVTYRPSHKATFIGLGVVAAILALNIGAFIFLLRGQSAGDSSLNSSEVTLSSESLDKLGVSKTAVGNLGTELTVGPNSKFNGKVTVASDVNIAGQLKLNSKFIASNASLSKLEAGDTALTQLNVNGDATSSNLTLRKDLNVAGLTRLQGPVTASQLFTINNSLNVSGNLAVGGTLSARGFQASSLVSDTTLTIGGHITTRGAAPGVSAGGAVGSNGTVSISGNDASGTVAVNVGVGASSGVVANISFRNSYGTTPHVVITPVGRGAGDFYVNRTAGGFSIGVSSPLSPGGYAFDYIVMQ